MTEAEWLQCSDPLKMLAFVTESEDPVIFAVVTKRKILLLAVACCERVRYLLTDKRSVEAISVIEQYADGDVPELLFALESNQASDAGKAYRFPKPLTAAFYAASTVAYAVYGNAVYDAFWSAQEAIRHAGPSDALSKERLAQRSILMDILGNPFHLLRPDLAWLTAAVVSLAQTIYDERAFERMRELADALQAAGCEDSDVLDHCRGSGPHVRGCWVIDLLLGKQ
jgi:hypothetical protein